ncbi:HEAT repeat [anaerobic digester metagenome]
MSVQNIESLLSLLHSPDKQIRADAVSGLIALGNEAVPYLLPLLEDEDWVIRYRALEALSGIRDTESIDSVIRTTADPKDHVRYMATKALGAMLDPRVVPVLIRMLSDDHSYTRKIAAGGLVRSGNVTVLPSLQKALESETDSEVRAFFEDALHQLQK